MASSSARDPRDNRQQEDESSAAGEEHEQTTTTTSSLKPSVKFFLLLLAFRVMCGVFLVRTYFDPDEYWQSVEVAHSISFPSSSSSSSSSPSLTWEWDPTVRLRGWLHPLLFSAAFSLLRLLGLDTPSLVAVTPRLIQAVFAALSDLYLAKMSMRVFHGSAPLTVATLVCAVTCWFNIFCGARTLSNTLEAQLTIISLCFWDLPGLPPLPSSSPPRRSRVIATAIAAITIIIRPTALVFWAPVGLLHLIHIHHQQQGGSSAGVIQAITDCTLVLIVVLGSGVVVDSLMYGRLTVVSFSFVWTNVVNSVATLYGTHPWHWYFTQGFPAMLGSFTPLFILGLVRGNHPKVIGFLVLWPLVVFSLLPHKEFRFVYPSLILAMLVCAEPLVELIRDTNTSSNKWKWLKRGLVVSAFILQLVGSVFFGLVWQRGPVAVMEHLRSPEVVSSLTSVDFLMPCHSTPWWSQLHIPSSSPSSTNASPQQWPTMRYLDCSPLSLVDESALFVNDPVGFVNNRFNNQSTLPSHIVTFERFSLATSDIIQAHFHICATFFHHFGDSLILFCSNKST